jgi:hypothetical protein
MYSTFKATEWLDIWLVGFVVFNATFNNISALSWQSVLLVEETGVPRENHRPVTFNHVCSFEEKAFIHFLVRSYGKLCDVW